MGIDAGAVIFVLERVTGSLAGSDAPEKAAKQAGSRLRDLKFRTLVQSPTHARARRVVWDASCRASGHVTLAIW